MLRGMTVDYELDVLEANYGRHDSDAQFVRGVQDTLDAVPGPEATLFDWLLWGISELDEDDKPQEHPLFRRQLWTGFDPDVNAIGWPTFNPLIVGRQLTVMRGTGQVSKASKGVPHLSPARQIVHGKIRPTGATRCKPLGAINHHAPRNTPELKTEIDACRREHVKVRRQYQAQGCSYLWTSDTNDVNYPLLPGEVMVAHGGLDYIVKYEAKGGARIAVESTSIGIIGIDPHHWHHARVHVTA